MVTDIFSTVEVDPQEAEWSYCVPVWIRGDYACFTRPDLSVERVSYPVMTPLAAVGIAEAVYWKPEMRYEVMAIDVLRPVSWMGLVRNELQSRQTDPDKEKWSGIQGDRTQRHSLILRDVEYVVYYRLSGSEHHLKYVETFIRRLRKGQHFYSPYMGCREFMADVELATTPYQRLDVSMDLGYMIVEMKRNDKGHALSVQHRQLHLDRGRISLDGVYAGI